MLNEIKRGNTHTHMHRHTLRYPRSPVVCVHVEGPVVIDPDWASQEEIPACLWPEVLQVSTLLGWSEAAVPSWLLACVRRLIGGWVGGGGGCTIYRFGKITSRSHRSCTAQTFSCSWVACPLPDRRPLRTHASIQTSPAVSNAALLFKVKPLRHPSCVGFLRWRLPDVQELFVGVLFVLVAAYALEQRHGEERVEDHYEEDVKVSVVVGLPEAGEANVLRAGAGRGRSRAAGRRSVCPLCFGSVLQELLAFGEERKQQGPVHLCHGAISNNRPKVPKQVKQTQLNNWESRTGLYPFRKGTPLAIRPLLIRRNASDKVHSSVPLGTSTSWPVWKFWFGPYLLI